MVLILLPPYKEPSADTDNPSLRVQFFECARESVAHLPPMHTRYFYNHPKIIEYTVSDFSLFSL